MHLLLLELRSLRPPMPNLLILPPFLIGSHRLSNPKISVHLLCRSCLIVGAFRATRYRRAYLYPGLFSYVPLFSSPLVLLVSFSLHCPFSLCITQPHHS